MKELDDFFLQNLEKFEAIFADIDYLGHQGTNKNSVFWLWKNGQKTEIKGINDLRENYLYVRYKNKDESLRPSSKDKSGLRWSADLRMTGVLFRCTNVVQISNWIAHLLNCNPNFSNISLNLNTLQVYEDEIGKGTLTNNDIQLFSIDFTIDTFLQDCDFNEIACNVC